MVTKGIIYALISLFYSFFLRHLAEDFKKKNNKDLAFAAVIQAVVMRRLAIMFVFVEIIYFIFW